MSGRVACSAGDLVEQTSDLTGQSWSTSALYLRGMGCGSSIYRRNSEWHLFDAGGTAGVITDGSGRHAVMPRATIRTAPSINAASWRCATTRQADGMAPAHATSDGCGEPHMPDTKRSFMLPGRPCAAKATQPRSVTHPLLGHPARRRARW
ncbi:MAG: hypothetical protein KGJ62_06365 [Armatimonadetes bacterium]|nr:hypothetical protein [Armatimonadota bacterium]